MSCNFLICLLYFSFYFLVLPVSCKPFGGGTSVLKHVLSIQHYNVIWPLILGDYFCIYSKHRAVLCPLGMNLFLATKLKGDDFKECFFFDLFILCDNHCDHTGIGRNLSN